MLSTFTVTNTSDNGDDLSPVPGSLRAAVVAANLDTDQTGARINFNMDPADANHVYYKNDGNSGQVSRAHVTATTAVTDATLIDPDPQHPQSWWSIAVVSPLPVLTRQVLVDGYSQAGSSTNTLTNADNAVLRIELNGAGLRAGDGSAFQGLAINRAGTGLEFGGNDMRASGNFVGTDVSGTLALSNGVGIRVLGTRCVIGGTVPAARNLISGNTTGVDTGFTTGNTYQGNFVGTDSTGTRAVANGEGLHINSRSDLIGGTAPGAGNLISGNGTGIHFNGLTAATRVQGNFIGTDVTGMAAVRNVRGIVIAGGGGDGTIGGTAPGAGNVISGNGIGVGGESGIHYEGNFIGTNKDGTAAVGNDVGLYLDNSSNNTIGGTAAGARNVISGNNVGISIASPYPDHHATGNLIQGNFIGTDVTGTRSIGNSQYGSGIALGRNASGNTIGGTTPGARNVISGNFGDGISLWRTGAGGDVPIGNTIQGNYIGTDVTGTVALGNGNIGIDVVEGNSNTIGGSAPGAGNVVAANGLAGIWLGTTNGASTTCTGNVVQGNLVGTDAAGAHALGNARGVVLQGGSGQAGSGVNNNLVGGATPAERNVISGNSGFGVAIVLAGSNTVKGNFIGTDVTGTVAIGNGGGVSIAYASPGNTIGGSGPGAGNLIAHSTTYGGVWIDPSGSYGPAPVGNTLRGNSIHDNAGLGIDLGQDGVTCNDLHAGQPGPNDWQNFPVLTAAYGGTSTYVAGSIHSTPGKVFTIDFYSNSTKDPTGHGEGQTYLGTTTVTTDVSGNASFQVPGLSASSPGQWVSATATSPNGSTSEFSKDVQVTLVPSTTTVVASASTPLFGDSVTFTATVNGAVPGFGTPSGSIQFAVDGLNVGSPVPLGGSTASFMISALAVGGHAVTASYSGNSTFQNSVGSTTLNVIPPATLSGVVFSDFNADGQVDFGEEGIAGVAINLTGIDDLGHPVGLSQTTDSAGCYVFLNLRPGLYTIAETQPAAYTQGTNTVGTGGGSVSGDQFSVGLAAGFDAMNYNYGERPGATGQVRQGQSASIGFWNNRNGQSLIRALNGGVGTQLGDWLAATFPHMFGAVSGTNNLAGQNNAFVASFFQSKFVVHGQKLDAQVLATALAVYVTNPILDNTGVGSQYGFIVSGNGLGTSTFDVGSNGEAFGVADNTVMTVMDLLLAVDAQAVNGVLYGGNTARRTKANNVFSAINQTGRIG